MLFILVHSGSSTSAVAHQCSVMPEGEKLWGGGGSGNGGHNLPSLE